jgi:hypothetical protein
MTLRKLNVPIVLLALLLTGFVTTPALAGLGFLDVQGGPIYSSPKAIGDAQAVLVKDKRLAPGAFRQGARDQATSDAIRAFQGEHFVQPTGMIDAETMALLESHGKATRLASSRLDDAVPQELTDRVQRDRDRKGAAGRQLLAQSHAAAPRQGSGTMAQADSGRTMPSTDSPLVFLAGLGGVLMLAGLFLAYGRRG